MGNSCIVAVDHSQRRTMTSEKVGLLPPLTGQYQGSLHSKPGCLQSGVRLINFFFDNFNISSIFRYTGTLLLLNPWGLHFVHPCLECREPWQYFLSVNYTVQIGAASIGNRTRNLRRTRPRLCMRPIMGYISVKRMSSSHSNSRKQIQHSKFLLMSGFPRFLRGRQRHA